MSIKGLFADFRDYITLRGEPEIRDFVEGFDWNLNQRNLTPKITQGARHLADAAAPAAKTEARLLQSLKDNQPDLHWGDDYDPSALGQNFYDNYGFVEMFGTRGHFDSGDMAGGFLLLGPALHYPSHRHVAEELFIPLTDGSYWMREGGTFEERKAGDIIVHESNEMHAMETPAAPLVVLYIWRGGDLSQQPTF